MTTVADIGSVEIRGADHPAEAEVLTSGALAFVALLQRRFGTERTRLLALRAERQARFDAGELPAYLVATRRVREREWTVAPPPKDLRDRRVEITGPTDRKMMINALNSGAKVFMADFEDSLAPTWANVVGGQANLRDAVRGTITFEAPGRTYRLNEETATLVVRPRGWHLEERRVLVDGEPVSASLFDFGLAFFHNARELLDRGSGPYFYLPKLESHLEARLWNEVFVAAQEELGLPRGTIRATVLIETVPAAFEMDEILFELREHASGLNAGRWDYIFSFIKKFRNRPDLVLPNRSLVTMTAPFMRAYTELMVRTCHRRQAYAIGGMAAFIPNPRDAAVNEEAFAQVRADKVREAGDGFDGTWVAHPGLVPVAREVFDGVLGDRPNQLHRTRDEVVVPAADLLRVGICRDHVSEQGLRTNVSVGIRYVESWLRGVGAAAIDNLMEDAATAEISRSQVWQWVHHGVHLAEGPRVTRHLVTHLADEEMDRIRATVGGHDFVTRPFAAARALFLHAALDDPFVEFLTVPAGRLLG